MILKRDAAWGGVFYLGAARVLLKFMHWQHLETWRVLRCGWQRGDNFYRHSVINLPFVEISWGKTPGLDRLRSEAPVEGEAAS